MNQDRSSTRPAAHKPFCFGTRRWYLPLAAIALFVVISLLYFDALIFYATDAFWHTEPAQELGRIADDLGHRVTVFLIGVLLIVLSRQRWRTMAPAMLFGLAIQGLLVNAIKGLVGRSRPCDLADLGVAPAFHGPAYDGNSFPSGHATVAFMIATLAAAYFPRWRWPAYALAVFVALGRIALDKHFLSDVTVGATLGYLVACLMLYRWPLPQAPSADASAEAHTDPD